MTFIQHSVSRSLPYDAAVLYGILADFREHHFRITPSTVVGSSYRVVHGGYGAGTIVEFESSLGHQTGLLRYVIDEPVPGRLLRLTFRDGVIVQTNELSDIEPGRCTLTMTVRFQCRGGILGWYDRIAGRGEIHRALEQKFDNLEQYAGTLGATVRGTGRRHASSTWRTSGNANCPARRERA